MNKLKFYFRVGIRNLFNQKRFTLINILGLSIGLSVSLLILLYVHYETSFENFNPNAGNIYRVVERNLQDGQIGARTPLALSDVLKEDYPEIDEVAGVMRAWKDVKIGQNRFEDLEGGIIERAFFNMFNLPFQFGDPNHIFQSPFEVVITSSTARKLFGRPNPIGESLEYEGHFFSVTGVIEDIPENSILTFDFFLSDSYRYTSYPDLHERWYEFGLYSFVTFHGSVVPENFESKLSRIEERYYPDFMKGRHQYQLIPFKGSHLNPSLTGDLKPGVSPSYIWILSGIALGVLVIACLNFINISIATLEKRNTEAGIKKVNGATPLGLISSYYIETGILIFLSLIIALPIVYLLLPSFNDLIDKNIPLDLGDRFLWVGIFGFGLLITLVTGLYPSLLFSNNSPIQLLFQRKLPTRKLTLQKSFVVIQFSISIVLGIGIIFISRQISYMQNHSTGFDKEDLVAISVSSLGPNGQERLDNTQLFIEELERAGYHDITITEFVPGFGFRNNFRVFDDRQSEGIEVLSCDIDEKFLDVYGLDLVLGRPFSKELASDRDALLINESALKELGWNNIENKELGLFSQNNRKKIIGVVRDINVNSMQFPVKPMIYQFGRHHNYPGYITVRVDPNSQFISSISSSWKSLFPDIPFTFENVADKYRSAYGEEEKLARIIGIFSVLTVILSLLGVFALSILLAQKRIKEIGIRRVNGARTSEILTLLNKDFARWVVIAFLIAIPIAWYAMHKWLENFAYKTSLSWWIYVVVGLFAVGITLITVSWQSWKAATRNPVEALRYE